MQFTYDAYRELLRLLRDGGYAFESYHTWRDVPRCVILRHDIDQSIEAALNLGRLEAGEGVCSTYFVLLGSQFYNPAAAASLAGLRELRGLGHEIGLHFDEVAYPASEVPVEELIQREADILSSICGFPVTTVSMHRPSKATLEADLEIPGIINSYGKTFFHDFKYLSDSRRRWREPVLDIIRSGEYDRLHILTHAFWYHEQEESISETVGSFINNGNMARYAAMRENIADLPSIMKESEVR